MTERNPITLAKAVRDEVYGILSEDPDLIGTYTFRSGATTPAIRVDDGTIVNADRETPKCTGLEVIISISSPTLSSYLDEAQLIRYPIDVVLKQWDITDTTRTAEMRLYERPLSNISQLGIHVPRNAARDTIEQIRIVVIPPLN